MLPKVITQLIKEYLGFDFTREYSLAIIRLIGRKNKSPRRLRWRTIDSSDDHLEFKPTIVDLQKYGVDIQTIHGSAFVSKQLCNQIINRRGSANEKAAEHIFENIMKVPNRWKVAKHTIDCTSLYMRNIAAVGGGVNMALAEFANFDFDLNRRYQVFRDTYALNF